MMDTVPNFPVLNFLGVVVQLGGALMLIGLFALLRRHVFRRAYFGVWAYAWAAFAFAILAILVRYALPEVTSAQLDDDHPLIRGLYFLYQMAKGLGFVLFLRGTLMYVAG